MLSRPGQASQPTRSASFCLSDAANHASMHFTMHGSCGQRLHRQVALKHAQEPQALGAPDERKPHSGAGSAAVVSGLLSFR